MSPASVPVGGGGGGGGGDRCKNITFPQLRLREVKISKFSKIIYSAALCILYVLSKFVDYSVNSTF